MPHVSELAASIPASGIRRIFELAATMDDVIQLAVGEPVVPVAAHIRRAGAKAWDQDDTDYTENSGVLSLRQALVDKLARVNGVALDSERVHVTAGGSQALHLAMVVTLSPGDEILIPNPGYSTFEITPRLVGGLPVPYPLEPGNGFMPDIDTLERLTGPRTRAILINSPSNPLGVVFPREVVEDLMAFAARHDLWVISDEVYEALSYGEPPVSAATIDPERTLGVYSLSKTYALTGARIGYLTAPLTLTERIRCCQEGIASCVNTPAQRAATAAVTGSQDAVHDAVDHYLANRRDAVSLLTERGFTFQPPGGAFYLWIDVSHASGGHGPGGDVTVWAEHFLRSSRVAVAPGSAFGTLGEGWIRVCCAGDHEELIEGLSRLPAPAAAQPVSTPAAAPAA